MKTSIYKTISCIFVSFSLFAFFGCTETEDLTSIMMIDYVDEYGVNHGQGVEIDGVVWAPVNCGYHETDYKYGKLYQWGRKYGQGYDGALYDGLNKIGEYKDSSIPEKVKGPVPLEQGQSKTYQNTVINNPSNQDARFCFDTVDKTLWNNGTEDNPIKSSYDPCPSGWRVPTTQELHNLSKHHSELAKDKMNKPGVFFSGSKQYRSNVAQVFFVLQGSVARILANLLAHCADVTEYIGVQNWEVLIILVW